MKVKIKEKFATMMQFIKDHKRQFLIASLSVLLVATVIVGVVLFCTPGTSTGTSSDYTSSAVSENEDLTISEPPVVSSEPINSEAANSSEPINSEPINSEVTNSSKPGSSGNVSSNPVVHKHTYATKVVAATCTANGYTTYTCTCGYSYNDNITYKKGHLYGDWTVTQNATTTSEGKKECSCTRCGHKLTETLPKKTGEHANIPESLEIVKLYSGVSYRNGVCSVVDRRTWGDVPTITVYDETSLHVVYYNKAGEKVEFDVVTPSSSKYTNIGTIKDDGTYHTQYSGSFGG